jgi:hypothetical protein
VHGTTLDELGGADELDGTTELLLGSSLPEEEDGSLPFPSPDDEQENVNAIARHTLAANRKPFVFIINNLPHHPNRHTAGLCHIHALWQMRHGNALFHNELLLSS